MDHLSAMINMCAELEKNVVEMAKRSLHQSSFRLNMRYREFEAFLKMSSFFQWFGVESPIPNITTYIPST